MKNRKEYGNGLVSYVRYYADYASERFNALDHNRKTMFIVGTATILVVIVVSLVFLTGPHYTPLYTNLNTQDAASIAAYLKNQKIPYQITGDGSTIAVPDAQKYQIRLDLANNNLPSGGSNIVGFESFDQSHFGETETEEKVRYVAALQGELERTIGQIDGVEGVRVHVVQPEDSLFVQDQKDATASVLLKLTPGYTLQDSQVLGITRLVSNAVEGLKPANVTVVDTSGNILSDDVQDSSDSPMSTDQMKIKQDYDKQLQDSIQSMLENVVGPGKAIVRANTTFNFDQVQIDSENYGDKQVQNDHTILTTNGSTAGQGAPGTTSNVPTYPQVSTQGVGQTQTSDKTTNYLVDTTTEHQVVAPGQIKQLSLSVVVDGQLDPVQQKQIEDMVSAAAGIVPARGDQLTVAGMPFNNQAATQAQQEIDLTQREHTYLNVFYILLALILAFLVLRYARKSTPQPVAQSYAGQGVSVEELLAGRKNQVVPRPDEAQENETQQVLEQLRTLAKSKPEETLVALRSWLTGE
jgi:flagellar M-ring protein FliF